MNLTETTNKLGRLLSRLTSRTVAKLGIALVLVLVSIQFAGSQFVTERQYVSALEINLSGRQRMLSQRIGWSLERLANLPGDASTLEKSQLRHLIAECVNLIEQSHRALAARAAEPMQTAMDAGSSCLGGNLTGSEIDMSQLMSSRVALNDGSLLENFANEAWSVAIGTTNGNQARTISNRFEGPISELLGRLNADTLQAQESSTEQIKNLLSINWFLICIVILGLIFLVFRPMSRAVDRSMARFEDASSRLTESEMRLQDFAATAAHQFWETDERHAFTYCASATPNTRLVRTSIALGKTLWEQEGVAETATEGGWTEFERNMRNHQSFNNFEYSKEQADGKKTWWRVHGRPVFSEEGEFRGYRGTSLEITQERLAEEKLRLNERMAAVGQLTAGVAHDFNNLLATVQGNAELLAIETNRADRDKTTHEIVAAVRRGAALTSRLLSFGRVQRLKATSIDVGEFLQDLNVLLSRTLGESFKIEIRMPSRPLRILADEHQLQDACLNLAINARDASPAGGELRIDISEHRAEPLVSFSELGEQESFVKISFRDQGSGISPDIQERIFEPFFTTKPVGSGSGLGLSMVYGFAHQSGGFVEISSEPGQGTTVELFLPQTDFEGIDPALEVSTSVAELSSLKALYVEDNDELREVTVKHLSRAGLHVTEAQDGNAALDRLEKDGPFDILILDIVLPGDMDGVDIARRALKSNADTKLLFCTGYARNRTSKLENLPGPVLNKPFSMTQLVSQVTNLVAERHQPQSQK